MQKNKILISFFFFYSCLENIQEKVCCLGAIDILEDYLREIQDETTLRMLVNVITGLVDTGIFIFPSQNLLYRKKENYLIGLIQY